MGRYLMILEVSQKQAYIFGSRKLRDNLRRSEEIRYVTSPEFFRDCCPELYTDGNLVNAGGGHTVLEFEDQDLARSFASAVTLAALRRFPELELFVKLMDYNEERSVKDNLLRLTQLLEEKKALRRSSFYRRAFGFGLDELPDNQLPVELPQEQAPAGWRLTTDSDALAGEDNFLAVVHIDGNGMGKRVSTVYENYSDDWECCKEALREFSREIDQHFREAYLEMTEALAEKLPALGFDPQKHFFPVRRIISAGDDVCFVTAGNLGLECAASMLEHLCRKKNTIDDIGAYSACAGVVLVHKSYPFREAYELSEQLCSAAKRFGRAFDDAVEAEAQERKEKCSIPCVSAIDWHIEFGQLRESLALIREVDYITEDGARLTLRPYVITGGQKIPGERQYAYFRRVLQRLREQSRMLPRSKIKSLREAMRQGEAETALALRKCSIEDLLYLGSESRHPDWLPRMINEREALPKEAFCTQDGERKCLFFDAIEIMDHTVLWREEP